MLSKTQRKTPTVVHKHYKIPRIRQFYMREVRYTQQNFHDRLSMILTEFPKIEVSILNLGVQLRQSGSKTVTSVSLFRFPQDIHPFYADLLNVLYDEDHYKLALGQINVARHLIDHQTSVSNRDSFPSFQLAVHLKKTWRRAFWN